MPRKKIIDAKSCKFSLDVSGENKEILDELTTNYMLKYGPMINKIISTFCRLPKSVKKVIEKSCLTEYERLCKEIKLTEESFHRLPLEQERDTYLEILKLINGGIYEVIDEKETSVMTKIKLVDGYLIIPDDWIVVNPEAAKNCRYATVLECRNSVKYGVPHFIYFSNLKYPRDYTKQMETDFFSLCQKAWPKFAEIKELSDTNKLIPYPENNGQYLNLEAHLAAPTIGLFHIEEQGERSYGEPPYGAMIVRAKIKEDEE